MVKMLAFDFGASSGRAVLGVYENNKLTMKEVHRFSNDPVNFSNHLQWDILRLTHEVKQALIKCKNNGDGDIDSIGVDTWGVDFGLLDKNGELLGNPYHYRDIRTEGMMEECFKYMPKDELFKRTGVAFEQFNTIYQLLGMKKMDDPALSNAHTLLLMPDLINYILTGEKVSEYTEATTTQLYNHSQGNWDEYILNKIGIPSSIFTKIVKPGTVIGGLRDSIIKESGLKNCRVISVGSHDTASAMAAAASMNDGSVSIATGTWALLGVPMDAPVTNEKAIKYNFTNEGGASSKVLMLKNIMGLWILQECRRAWIKGGRNIDFGEMVDLAEKEAGGQCRIDPDDNVFFTPGDMPSKIAEYCHRTGQKAPEGIGQIVRCVEESLAYKFKWGIERVEEITGKNIDTINIVGGGVRDRLLCSLTESITGRKVSRGPVEATAVGNLITQAIALGEVKDFSQMGSISVSEL